MNQLLFQYLNNLAGKFEWLDMAVVFFAEYLGYWLLLGFIVLLVFKKTDLVSKIKIFIFTALSVVIARLVITEIIRYFYYIPRPFVNNEVYQLIIHDPTGSLPSGHAAFFFALAMAVYLFLPQTSLSAGQAGFRSVWIALFFAGAIIIGISRVIAGIHWPADILAGAMVGILSALIVKMCATRWRTFCLYKKSSI